MSSPFILFHLQEIPDALASYRIAQLAQSLGLDLSDTLSGNIKLFSHFLKGSGMAVFQTKTQDNDLALSLF